MSFKLFIVFCIGALTVQGENIQDHNVSGTFDALIKIFEELEDQVKAVIDNALKTVNKAMEDIATYIDGLISDISEQAEKIIAPFIEKINELEEEAAQVGVDISDCIGDNIDVINSLPKQLVTNVTECLETKYQDAQTLVAEIISEINATFDKVEGYWNEISECQNKSILEQPICITELTAEITSDAVKIPITVASLLKNATEYIATLQTDLLLCTSGKLTELTQEVTDIVANITTCSMKKINSRTTSEAPTTTSNITTTDSSTTSNTTTTDSPTTSNTSTSTSDTTTTEVSSTATESSATSESTTSSEPTTTSGSTSMSECTTNTESTSTSEATASD